jgi:hypothetical protein
MGLQDKGSAAPLANGGQTPTGDRSLPQSAAVRLRHELHQFPPLGKRPASAVPMSMSAAASTSRHIETPSKVLFKSRQAYSLAPGKSLTWVKEWELVKCWQARDRISTNCNLCICGHDFLALCGLKLLFKPSF